MSSLSIPISLSPIPPHPHRTLPLHARVHARTHHLASASGIKRGGNLLHSSPPHPERVFFFLSFFLLLLVANLLLFRARQCRHCADNSVTSVWQRRHEDVSRTTLLFLSLIFHRCSGSIFGSREGDKPKYFRCNEEYRPLQLPFPLYSSFISFACTPSPWSLCSKTKEKEAYEAEMFPLNQVQSLFFFLKFYSHQ